MENDEITDLIALRDNQLRQRVAKGRPSTEQRLAPYRSQLRQLVASSPSPTVRELVELLAAAGVKVHRVTLTKYLRREFNWESPQKRGKKEEATPPNKKTTPKSEDSGNNKPIEKPAPKRSASVDTSAIEAALSANMSHRSKTNE